MTRKSWWKRLAMLPSVRERPMSVETNASQPAPTEVPTSSAGDDDQAELAPVGTAGDVVLERIRSVDSGSAEATAAALGALREAAGTQLEKAALAACLVAHGSRRAPAELLCLAAELFARRGAVDTALALLEDLAEPRAWQLQAELRAARGQYGLAVQLLERVLAYDIDAPGALESLQRWRTPTKPPKLPAAEQPTLLGAEAARTSLRIIGEAGRGGAATVYQAEDVVLGREVALKVYHSPERQRSHLLREAKMAVALAGPGVVRVFDADLAHGWVVMEWAPGGSFAQRMQQASDSPALDPRGWFAPFVQTLGRIHRAGFVHADLKPANLLFRRDGNVLLSDFGLTVPIGARHVGSSASYVSPERAQGGHATPSDDVYALGRILSQVLAVASQPSAALAPWQRLAGALQKPARPPDAVALLSRLPD